MLSDSQRAVVKSTVPLLETGGEALTTHFYRMMLDEYPEVRPLFNQAHQASGAQPRALAHGVLMYAKHIDQLDQLGGLVSQIVNKHVALQILPEHYPIVGSCLLRAIREVLGEEIATDEVIDAWGAAYGQLADLLIGAEGQMYDAKENATGGWRGARDFVVDRMVPESSEITSFYLRPADGGKLLAYEPGQYIGLQLFIDGEEIRRNYSLSAAHDPNHYRISVKREPGGKASNWLHDTVKPGSVLRLFPPAGDFVLRSGEKPLVLITGGVGITPTLAMLEHALPTGRPVYFIHAARNADVHAFRDWVDEQAKHNPQLKRFYVHAEPNAARPADAVGLLDADTLTRWLPVDRDVDAYLLGPVPFMKAVRRQLREIGVPEGQTRHEFFGPAGSLD